MMEHVPPSISSPPAPGEGVFSGRLLSMSSHSRRIWFWSVQLESADLGSYGSSYHLIHASNLQMYVLYMKGNGKDLKNVDIICLYSPSTAPFP